MRAPAMLSAQQYAGATSPHAEISSPSTPLIMTEKNLSNKRRNPDPNRRETFDRALL
jgi:hypothetical protein